MSLIDAHAHLHLIKDIEGAIERAKKCNVKAILACGYSYEANRKVLELPKKFPIVKPIIGTDPQAAMESNDLSKELELIRENKDNIRGIGEIGLDFKYAKTEEQLKKQYTCFEIFTDFAVLENLPLVVHSREAEKEVLEFLIKKEANKVMLHCFSGSFELALKAVEKGYYISIPPISSSTREKIIKHVPLESLMLETDAPFIGKEPSDVIKSAEMIAKTKGVNIEEVANTTTNNCVKLFNLSD
jgi:TatD DNase family protein